MPAEIPANLKPSLLDRLVDVSASGPSSPQWYTPAQVIDAVRRDLESLLNTRQTCQQQCAELEDVKNSLITYGIPDAASLAVVTAAQRNAVAREIEQTIARFEPRLSRVKVNILQPATRKDRVLRLGVTGRLNVDPAIDVGFDGSLELTTGHISMANSL